MSKRLARFGQWDGRMEKEVDGEFILTNQFGEFFKTRHTPNLSHNSKQRIAVVLSDIENPWERSLNGSFQESLLNGFGPQKMPNISVYAFKSGRHNNEEQVLWSLARGKYDLVVTIGSRTSFSIRNHLYSLIDKGAKAPGMIFVGLDRPTARLLVQNEKNPGVGISGVMTKPTDHTNRVETFFDFRPDAKRILLAYDPHCDSITKGLDRSHGQTNRELFAEALATRGVEVLSVPVATENDVKTLFDGSYGKIDIICLPNESSPITYAHTIARECMKNKITLCASDLRSVFSGAAFGFGSSGYEYGVAASYIAYIALAEQEKMSDIPIREIAESEEIRFNPQTMRKQRIIPDEKTLRTMNMRSIFAND